MCVNLCVSENDYFLIKKNFGGTDLCPAKLRSGENVRGNLHPEIKELLEEMIDINRRVNLKMQELVEKVDFKPARDVAQYAISLSSTRDRANCMHWSLQCVEKEWRPEYISLAASVELIHLASLLADEIFDESETCAIEDGNEPPKPQPSTWAKFDKERAFSAAELFVSLAMKNVLEIGKSKDVGDKTYHIIDKLVETINQTYIGQIMDRKMQAQEQASYCQYHQMISALEGNPLKLAIEIGLLFAGARDEEIKILGKCGDILGSMFKLRNDIIDIIGHEKALGKKIAGDLAIKEGNPVKLELTETKKTLPIIRLIRNIPKPGSLQLSDTIFINGSGNISTSTTELARIAIIKYLKQNIINECQNELRSLGARVLCSLDILKPTGGRERLETLTKFVAERFSLEE